MKDIVVNLAFSSVVLIACVMTYLFVRASNRVRELEEVVRERDTQVHHMTLLRDQEQRSKYP